MCPHTETSAGMMVSNDYIRAIAEAVHQEEDAIFVLDGIASGNVWIDMKELGVDVYITAPQKGWTAPASVGIAMMSERAKKIMNKQGHKGTSFCCNLAKWSGVADKYAAPGGFAYHTTLPTDALMTFRDVIMETKRVGYALLEQRANELGSRIREILESRGFKSVAAEGYQSPSVVVAYNRSEADCDLVAKFKRNHIQIAGGVPLKVDEPWAGAPPTFRIGLFGLDKLLDVDKTVLTFEHALDKILEDKQLKAKLLIS